MVDNRKSRSQLWETIKNYYKAHDYGNHKQYRNMTTSGMVYELERIRKINNKAKRITGMFKINKARDITSVRKINRLPSGKEMRVEINRFNRIKQNIISPDNKMLWASVYDTMGNKLYSVNIRNENLNNKSLQYRTDNIFIQGSDVDENYDADSIIQGYMTLEWVPFIKKISKSNQFFRYVSLLDYKLERYQLYFKNTDKKEYINIPCLLWALKKSNIDDDTIKTIAVRMGGEWGCTVANMKKLTMGLPFVFKVSIHRNDTNKVRECTWGTIGRIVKLAIVGEHIFINEKTNITKSALLHPEYYDHEDYPSIIVQNKGMRNGKQKVHIKKETEKTLTSYEVISFLYTHKDTMLEPITMREAPNLFNNKFAKIESLCESDVENSKIYNGSKMIEKFKPIEPTDYKQLFKFKKDDENKFIRVFYIDFETLADETGKHVEYCLSFKHFATIDVDQNITNKIKDAKTCRCYGLDCSKNFLNHLTPGSYNLIYAHNMGFDSKFLIRHLTGFSDETIITSGSRVKELRGQYYGRRLLLKDTLSFLNTKLAKLPEMFPNAYGETLGKECFPHNLINMNNFNKPWSFDYLKDYAELETLKINATKIGAWDEDKQLFDTQKYASHYCDRDVDVLSSCFENFRQICLETFDLDVYYLISAPQMAYKYQLNEGCFEDVYNLSGVCLEFVREAIVGGRVMTRDNKKHHTHCELSDFDCTSLYPSSMFKIGYPKGLPKLFKNTIPNCDYFVVRAKVLSIGTERHFPLLFNPDADGREWTNDVIGKTLILDKFMFEDAITFQNTTFEVIEGLYWDEGLNMRISEVINFMFEERIKAKKQCICDKDCGAKLCGGNPVQEVYKLLMNSSYGKLIQKPIKEENVMVSNTYGRDKDGERIMIDCIGQYVAKHIHRIKRMYPVGDNKAYFVLHKNVVCDHQSPAHCGTMILGRSKRIMNEVMCLAEDLNLNIYYQDTDSMHIERQSIPVLSEAFKVKYGRELIGKSMGQFHSDFSLDKSEGEVYAVESIFLGKKAYIDDLVCEGNIAHGYHIRLKGCPSSLISKDPMSIYNTLYDGKFIEIDLAKACPLLLDSKRQIVMNRDKFIRRFSF